MAETLKCVREKIDGVWYHVHVSADGKLRVNTGPDDQRPEHDGLSYFRPTCVAQYLSDSSDSLYTYHWYCGACLRYIGTLGSIRECCPRCGHHIAHYVFDMGVEKFVGSFNQLPKEWPLKSAGTRP